MSLPDVFHEGEKAVQERAGQRAAALRNVNGVVRACASGTMDIEVREAFPNCPKYIQRRQPGGSLERVAEAASERGEALDDARRDLIARVDTAFVASGHASRGVDASHRGGAPGFIRVAGTRELRFPDYPGNAMFQTLGNLEVDPRAGLALVDFERARVLSLTGTAVASFGEEEPSHPSGGTGRYWTFSVERWIEHALEAPVAWELLDRSPFNPSPSASASWAEGSELTRDV